MDDFTDDGDIPYNIVLGTATSSDGNYNIDAADVPVTNIDNDTAGVTVGTISGDTSEDGTNATFTVILDSQPTADVLIPVTSDTPTEGTPDVTDLTFTSGNWNVAQTVTVTGVDDELSDGEVEYGISLTSTSSDADYSGLTSEVTLTNTDDEEPVDEEPEEPVDEEPEEPVDEEPVDEEPEEPVDEEPVDEEPVDEEPVEPVDEEPEEPVDEEPVDGDIAGVKLVLPVDRLDVIEGVESDRYKIVLTAKPTANVTITVTSDRQTEIDITEVVFTPNNWDTPQIVTVEAADDRNLEDIATSTITHTVSSEDSNYDGIDVSELVVNVNDNDNFGDNLTLANSKSISAVNMTESDDTVIGSADKNIIYGKNGNDRLAGEAGNDFLYGKDGADGIYGGEGDDMIYGGLGEDYIKGDADNDKIFGSEGSDRLFGGNGNDRIFGDEGNDYIEGNAGSDTLTGGDGKDAFALDLDTGVTSLDKLTEIDVITDFNPQDDRIDLGTMTFNEINLIPGTGNWAGSTLIKNAETQDYLAVLKDVNSNSLDSDNFI